MIIETNLFSYKVKVINSNKKSDYTVKKLESSHQFQSVQELVSKLSHSFTIKVNKVGYMLPGHGLKGKHHYISTDDQIPEMYELFSGKREILLCCWYGTGTKSVVVEDDDDGIENIVQNPVPVRSKRSTKSDAIAQKINDAEEVMNTLAKIHKNYTSEQLSSWAHLIQMGKHHSYDNPPDYPYFKGNKRSRRKSADSGDELPRSPTFSPCKKVQIRSECIDQLQKWHNLLEKGGISKEQYEELQKTIMADMS